MFGKLLLIICLACAAAGHAWGALDVNTADQAALQGIKGLGPAKAGAIVAERDANGAFKNAGDLAARIKGLGPKLVARLQSEGLSVGAAVPVAAPKAVGKPTPRNTGAQ